MPDLDAVEARLRDLLDRYRPPLVDGTIYGIPSLIWPGATGHAYFAAVKRNAANVALYAIVADTYAAELEGAGADLLRRRTGRATFRFTSLDDELAAELGRVLDLLFARYRADHESPP